MRIAYISYECPPDSSAGGIATYIQQVTRVMAERGHDVEVFAASSTRSGLVKEEDGVSYNWVKETSRHRFAQDVLPVFAERHQQTPFDVVEGTEFRADASEVAKAFPELPLVVKMHTPSAELCRIGLPSTIRAKCFWSARILIGVFKGWGNRKKFRTRNGGFRRFAESRVNEAIHAREADLVAAPCLDLCAYAEKYWAVDRNRIRWVPYPYVPAPAYLSQENLEDDKLVVGFVGRLERRKGVENLAACIPLVAEKFPEVVFQFVGAIGKHPVNGMPYDQWIRERAKPFQDQVEFTGKIPLEKLPEVYGGFTVCALPSIWENFPNTCLEAMSAGRLIVATWTGGMSEMLENGRHGVLVPPNDPESLAEAIIKLLQRPELRFHFGNSARQRVLGAYNADRIGRLTEDIFEEAVWRKNRAICDGQ